MKKTMMYLFLVLSCMVFHDNASAKTLTWTGGGTNDLASNHANWSGTNLFPEEGDNVIFNSTNKNCTWDMDYTLSSIAVTSGYSGKITKPAAHTLRLVKGRIWTGGGTDNLASNPDNWLGGAIPVNGDSVVFDSTFITNCTWDLNISLSSFSLRAGFSNMVTLGNSLTVTGDLTAAGGTLNLNNQPLNVDGDVDIQSAGTLNATDSAITIKGDWSNTGTFNEGSSTVTMNGIDQWISGDTTFYDLVSNPSGSVTLNNDTAMSGSFEVRSGIFDLNGYNIDDEGYLFINTNGTLDATSSTLFVAGDWDNRGSFIPGTSTVILDGINQTIWGDNTFYNLEKVTVIALTHTLKFEANKIQTILNNLILQGSSSGYLQLFSTSTGQAWYIDPRGTRSVSYTNIRDLHNLNFADIIVTNSGGTPDNIYGVSFGGGLCVN